MAPINPTNNRRRRQRTRVEISLCINAFCSSNILVLMRSDASLRSWSLVLYQQQEHYYTHKTSNKVRKSCLLCCVSDNFRNSINKAAHPVSTSSYTSVDMIWACSSVAKRWRIKIRWKPADVAMVSFLRERVEIGERSSSLDEKRNDTLVFPPIIDRDILLDRNMRVNQVRLHGNYRTRWDTRVNPNTPND